MADQDGKEHSALDAGITTPIASLNPDITDLKSRVVDGEVTITWPYSIITKSVAFVVAESDFRLRRERGQVRVEFYGAASAAISRASIEGGDQVRISLDGAEWEPPQAMSRLPGTPLEWQLKFTNRLLLRCRKSGSDEPIILDIDGPPQEADDTDNPLSIIAASSPLQSPVPSTPRLLSPPSSTLPKRPAVSSLDTDEYASPAFVKRARVSYGSLIEGGIDSLDDDARRKKQPKKRARFSMGAMGWRYSSKSPSPEPENQDELEEPSDDEDELEETTTQGRPAASPIAQIPEPDFQQVDPFVPPTPTPVPNSARTATEIEAVTTLGHGDVDTFPPTGDAPLRFGTSQSTTYGQTANLFASQPPLQGFGSSQIAGFGATPSSLAPGPGFGLQTADHEPISAPHNPFQSIPVTSHEPASSLFGAPPVAGLSWQSHIEAPQPFASVSHHTSDTGSPYPDIAEDTYPLPGSVPVAEQEDLYTAEQSHPLDHRARSVESLYDEEDEEDEIEQQRYPEERSPQRAHRYTDAEEDESEDDEDAESEEHGEYERDDDSATAYEIEERERRNRTQQGYDESEEESQYDEEEDDHYDEPARHQVGYEEEESDEDRDADEDEEEDEEEDDEEEEEQVADDRGAPTRQPVSSQPSQPVVIDLLSDSDDDAPPPPPKAQPAQPIKHESETREVADQPITREESPSDASRSPSPEVSEDEDAAIRSNGSDGQYDEDEEDEEVDDAAASEQSENDAHGTTQLAQPEPENDEADIEEEEEDDDLELVKTAPEATLESGAAQDDESIEEIADDSEAEAIEKVDAVANVDGMDVDAEDEKAEAEEVVEEEEAIEQINEEPQAEEPIADIEDEEADIEMEDSAVPDTVISPPITQVIDADVVEEQATPATEMGAKQLPTPAETQFPSDVQASQAVNGDIEPEVEDVASTEDTPAKPKVSAKQQDTIEEEPAQVEVEDEDSIAAEEQIMEELRQYQSPPQKDKLQAAPPISTRSLRSRDKENSAEPDSEAVNTETHPAKLDLPVPRSPRRHRKRRSTDSTARSRKETTEPPSPTVVKKSNEPPIKTRATRSRATKADPSLALVRATQLEEQEPAITKSREASPELHRPVTRSMDETSEADAEKTRQDVAEDEDFTAPSTRQTRREETPEMTELDMEVSTPTQVMEAIEQEAAVEEAAEATAPTTEPDVVEETEPTNDAVSEDTPKPKPKPKPKSKTELLKPLKKLPEYLSLDKLARARERRCNILAVAACTPDEAKRPKNGPRDYMMELALLDPTSSSTSLEVRIAQLYRPHKRSLPMVEAGDVVMLREVEVHAMAGRDFGVKICDESSWAVFEQADEEMLPQIRGPPVEDVTDEEIAYVKSLRAWWDSLDDEKVTEANEMAKRFLHMASSHEANEGEVAE